MPKDLGVDDDLIPLETIESFEKEVDVLSNITSKARARRRGENHADDTKAVPDPLPIQQESNIAIKKAILQTSNKESNTANNITRKQESKKARKQESNAEMLVQRLEEGHLIPVTFRLPSGTTDWLAECQYRFRQHKISKQDLVKLGLQLLALEVEQTQHLPDLHAGSERKEERE